MANALQAVLDKANRDPAPAAPVPPVRKAPSAANAAKPAGQGEAPDPSPKFHRPSRDNRRFVGGHFAPAVGKQLRMIAVEDETTVQALLEEALDLLFVKKGRQKIADLSQ
jgi:hypothetical protein